MTGASFQANGNGVPAILSITGHNFDLSVISIDVTSTIHQGITAKMPTRRDGRGTLNAIFDLNNPPYLDPPRILPGVFGYMNFFVASDQTQWFAVPSLIVKTHWETSVNDVVRYSFDIELSGLLGPVIYPGVPGFIPPRI
ncbi:MAG: hypothetical protein V4597_11655 [Pseudomonadota bacterium]